MSRIAKVALVVLALLLIVFPLLSTRYTIQSTFMTITYTMLGLAFAFSMRVGLPRIDIAAWFGIGGWATVLLMNSGLNYWLASLGGGIITVILGGLVFSVVLRRGMVVFFVFCLMCLYILPSLMTFASMVPFLRGTGGIVPPPTIGSFTIINQRDVYYLGLFFLALNLLVYYLLYNSKIGRAWTAINSSLGLSHSVGINVVRYRIANILIGNFFISLAGSYFVAHFRLTPQLLYSFQAGVLIMAYPMIGGITHSLLGPIIGAIIGVFIPGYYLTYIKTYSTLIFSVIAILIVAFLPLGIMGWVDHSVKPWLYRRQWYVRLNNWGVKEKSKIPPVV
jgi:branched-chain amino acid transport system permease protein